jgi:DNA repair exonuclease SbcCD ATPase subunit
MGPNGSGKSTLLDALTFSLFGKPFRKVNKGNVINSINGKNCVVEIEFSISEKHYKVIRGVKPNVFEIWVNDIMLNQDAAVRDYQEHLEKHILRMNFKTFTQVVILGSASFIPFMQLSPADRRSVIENLLDIQIFSVMSSIAKNKLQVNRDHRERNRLTLNSKEENKSYVERTLRSLKQNSEEKLAELKETNSGLESERAELMVALELKEKQIDTLLSSANNDSTLRVKHTKLVALQTKMEHNKSRLEKANSFYHENDSCPTCLQDISEDFKQDSKSQNDTKINEINDGLNKITIQIESCIDEISKIDSILDSVNKLRIHVSSDKSSLRSIEKHIEQIKQQIAGFATSDKAVQDSERQLKVVTSDISVLQKEKETLLDEKQYIDTMITILKDGGIKTRIIKQYLPIINKHINRYLSNLGFFVNFEIDENFEESIKSRYRDEFSYNNFSEGEKLRIDLSILLTWRQIAKLKNSVNVNIIVFDEILDRAMDSSGVDEFIRLMWDMGDDTNVFIISHKEGVSDRFQRTLKFEKVKNFSVLAKDD